MFRGRSLWPPAARALQKVRVDLTKCPSPGFSCRPESGYSAREEFCNLMRFFNNSTHSQARQIVLLAPAEVNDSSSFGRVRYDAEQYESLLGSMQRLRGAVYLADGAIDSNALTADGRHWSGADRESWHVLSLNSEGRVQGCARYLPYCADSVRFETLSVGRSALARCPEWSSRLVMAVEREIALAKQRGVSFVEVGGWALAEEVRRSCEALRIALASYALGRKLGGSIGLTTATVRHCSSTILRKLGGMSMFVGGSEIPRYFDPQYRCDMEILRFDSSEPSSRYEALVNGLVSELSEVPVVSASPLQWRDQSESLLDLARPRRLELMPQLL